MLKPSKFVTHGIKSEPKTARPPKPPSQQPSGLKLNISVTDTETFKEFLSLSLWMFRRLHKSHQEFAYEEIEKILGKEFDLKDFDDLRK